MTDQLSIETFAAEQALSEAPVPPVAMLYAFRELTSGLAPNGRHRAIAREVITACNKHDGRGPFQEEALAYELWTFVRYIKPEVDSRSAQAPKYWAMPPLDRAAVTLFNRLGPTGKAQAIDYAQKATRRWEAFKQERTTDIWRNWYRPERETTPIFMAALLAKLLWQDNIKPKLERMPCPALPNGVLMPLLQAIKESGNHFWTHRVLRWVIHTAFAKHLTSEGGDDKLLVPGGFSALASALGASSNRTEGRVSAAVKTLASLCSPYRGEPWLTYKVQPSTNGRAAVLTLCPHESLCPGYATAMPARSRSQRRARELVPVPQVPVLFAGSSADRGPQCVLQLLLLQLFRAKAALCAKTGGVPITPEQWQQLASEAGVPDRFEQSVLELWTTNTAEAPAMFCRRGNVIGPGVALRSEAATIADAAKRHDEGLLAQQRSKSRHRRKRAA